MKGENVQQSEWKEKEKETREERTEGEKVKGGEEETLERGDNKAQGLIK